MSGNDESPDALVGLRPDDRDVRDRPVGYPHLATLEHPIVTIASGSRSHARGVGPGIRFGQTEASDDLPRRHPGQPLILLLFAPPPPDRVHRERPLHRDERTDARVRSLELEACQAVLGGRHSRAPVSLEVHAEHPELTEVFREAPQIIDLAPLEPVTDVRNHAPLDEGADRITRGALVVAEQRVDVGDVDHVITGCHGLLLGAGHSRDRSDRGRQATGGSRHRAHRAAASVRTRGSVSA